MIYIDMHRNHRARLQIEKMVKRKESKESNKHNTYRSASKYSECNISDHSSVQHMNYRQPPKKKKKQNNTGRRQNSTIIREGLF